MAGEYTQQIAQTSRDRWGTTSLNNDVNWLRLAGLAHRVLTGFDGLNVPQGENITTATLTYHQRGAPTATPRHVRVHAMLRQATNPNVVDLSGAATTAYGVSPLASDVPDSTVTVDITAVVQELVNRPEWAGNSNGWVLLRGQRDPNLMDRAGAWDFQDVLVGAELGAILHVEWGSQYLDPEPFQGVGRFAPVEAITYSLDPNPFRGVGRFEPVDVIAPRTVHPANFRGVGRFSPTETRGTGQGPTVAPPSFRGVGRWGIPFLSMTAPPDPEPEPWERLILNPYYHQAITDPTSTRRTRAEIIDENGAIIARLGGPDATHPGAVEGTVTMDTEQAVRWSADLTLDNPDLLPTSPLDLLHPLSRNQVRIWYGLWIPTEGRWGEIPVGTYYPAQTPHSDDGRFVSNRVLGFDAVARIKRAGWQVALDLSGAVVTDAIAEIIEDRAPWATYVITPATATVPPSYEPGEPGADPWDDVRKLAEVVGMVAYCDRMGVIRVEPRPGTGPADAHFVEGKNSALLGLPRVETDLSELVNHVTVTSADPDVDPPITGVAFDDDPTSWLYVPEAGLYTHHVSNPLVTTQAQAENWARNILDDRAPVATLDALVEPHPHLDGGDTVNIARARAGVAGDYTLTKWTLGLHPTDKMQITATTRKDLAQWATA